MGSEMCLRDRHGGDLGLPDRQLRVVDRDRQCGDADLLAAAADPAEVARFAQAAQDTCWSAGNVRKGADTLAADSPFRCIAEKGLEGASKHTGMLGAVDYNTWLTMSLQRAIQNVQNRMQDGLALLATVGSTAPFVGLFGTVWGIYNALVKIGMSGQASIDKVAGPVGESLNLTASGLAGVVAGGSGRR